MTKPRSAVLAMASGVRLSNVALAAVNLSVAGYLGVLTVAGARRPQPLPPTERATRFTVLVPAHNEAAVISDALRGFDELDYPRTHYDVHVVADNCTDATSQIVRRHGWNAHDRTDPQHPGKGPALNWLFHRLATDLDASTDVVVVVDADTVLDAGFLDAMDRAFNSGAQAAQGWYSVRRAGDSPSAGIRFAALACRHYLRPLGRTRLGASCGLYGNGMAFRAGVLRRQSWSGHLVEDAEFQLELLLRHNVRVTYVPQARLEAEMPNTFDASANQNTRWERGRIELARRYVPELLQILVSGRSRRLVVADATADLLIPPLSTVAVLQLAGLANSALTAVVGRRRPDSRFGRWTVTLHLVALGTLVAHVVVALRSVDAPRSAWRSLLHAPKAVIWKSGLWASALRPKQAVTWTRTRRNTER
jgi:cellulose synthase/poly-beta-1,6-N-acetylglucosamine synthase-like glycosyltransferase